MKQEILNDFVCYYRQAFNRPDRFLLWIFQMLQHLIMVFYRRLWQGPKRRHWSVLHEIVIEMMQFNYRHQLAHAKENFVLFESVWNKHFPNKKKWHDLTTEEQEEAKNKILIILKMTTDKLLTHCTVQYIRSMIQLMPKVPYLLASISTFYLPTTKDGHYNEKVYSKETRKSFQVDVIKPFGCDPKNVLIFVHGGGFNFSMEATWRLLVQYLSYRLQCAVIVPHYRLAPEHPFPAAIHDLSVVYQWLLLNHQPEEIGWVGESAGAGAIVSACLLNAEKKLPRPAFVYLMSPWIDLTCKVAHIDHLIHDNLDSLLSEKSQLRKFEDVDNSWLRYYPNDLLHLPVFPFDLSANYAGQTKITNPTLSPYFATSAQLSAALPDSILIQLGANEYLLDEGLVLAQRIQKYRNANPDIKNRWLEYYEWHDKSKHHDTNTKQNLKCEIYEDMTHVFQLFFSFGYYPSRVALEKGIQFIQNQYSSK